MHGNSEACSRRISQGFFRRQTTAPRQALGRRSRRSQLSHDATGVIAGDIQLRCRIFPLVHRRNGKLTAKTSLSIAGIYPLETLEDSPASR
jgi:hypothetical protein